MMRLFPLLLFLLPLALADDPAIQAEDGANELRVYDISTLHEYVYRHPDDDPGMVEAVRASAVALEKTLDRQSAEDSASPPSN